MKLSKSDENTYVLNLSTHPCFPEFVSKFKADAQTANCGSSVTTICIIKCLLPRF